MGSTRQPPPAGTGLNDPAIRQTLDALEDQVDSLFDNLLEREPDTTPPVPDVVVEHTPPAPAATRYRVSTPPAPVASLFSPPPAAATPARTPATTVHEMSPGQLLQGLENQLDSCFDAMMVNETTAPVEAPAPEKKKRKRTAVRHIVDVATPRPAPQRRASSRRWHVLGALGALSMITLAVVVLRVGRGRHAPDTAQAALTVTPVTAPVPEPAPVPERSTAAFPPAPPGPLTESAAVLAPRAPAPVPAPAEPVVRPQAVPAPAAPAPVVRARVVPPPVVAEPVVPQPVAAAPPAAPRIVALPPVEVVTEAPADPTPAIGAFDEPAAPIQEQVRAAIAPPDEATIPAFLPPEASERHDAAYPAQLRKRGVAGTVVLKVLVSEDGRVVRVVTHENDAGPELEAAAIDAVLRWRYRPAEENGHAIRGWATETFVFEP